MLRCVIAAYRQHLVILVSSIRRLHEREKEQKEVSDGAHREWKGSKTSHVWSYEFCCDRFLNHSKHPTDQVHQSKFTVQCASVFYSCQFLGQELLSFQGLAHSSWAADHNVHFMKITQGGKRPVHQPVWESEDRRLKSTRNSRLTNCSTKSLKRGNLGILQEETRQGNEKTCFSLTTPCKLPFSPNWQLWLRASSMAHTVLPWRKMRLGMGLKLFSPSQGLFLSDVWYTVNKSHYNCSMDQSLPFSETHFWTHINSNFLDMPFGLINLEG